MSVRDITKDLNKLDKQLDALDDALKPLLKALNESASSMLLLDRAKLFTLANYALETLIFAGLRVDGADAMDHPVFKTELMRVKQYFAKIEAVEKPAEAEAATSQQQQPAVRLNTEAATRMIKHGLSDDAALKTKLAEQVAKEKAKAFMRSLGSAKRPLTKDDEPSATPVAAATSQSTNSKTIGDGGELSSGSGAKTKKSKTRSNEVSQQERSTTVAKRRKQT
ncbi:Exosome complex protein.07 [Ceratocystis lukuohia]|uniref:Exosome complex protein n=1 Tax=Ceratocystis lukuohia TaxID=2019550 RepID=A0ABR4M9C6_9PEZI